MIDVNQPVTNPALVAAMNQMQQGPTAEKELMLIEEIARAHFLTPMILDGAIENGVLKAGSTISFKTISNGSGENFFLAFTDWEELGKWSSEPEQTLISTYDDLKSMVLNNEEIRGFVINPYGQSVVITPELIDYFTRRKTEIVVEEDTQILLGQPADYPEEMVNALQQFFEEHHEVEKAYLFLAQIPGAPQPNWLLVVDFIGEKNSLFPQIAAVTQGFLGADEYIDLVPMDSAFGGNAAQDATPFYQKSAI
ncbi:MAG TPA: enhanced serine sensitivity protein SseB [Bacillota bacterium]|nr:enhanced serine sensitivity protein SseB [Bacillota bacterium]